MPMHETLVSLIDLNSSDITLSLNTSLGMQDITSFQIADDKRSITFVAPQNVIDGELILSTKEAQSNYAYVVVFASTPYMKSLSPDVVKAGDSVEIIGENLPSLPVQVIFEGQDSSLMQIVTPSNSSVSFTVPQGAGSGNIYLKINQIETNRLSLSIKRSINTKIILGDGVDINASEISFILGLKEYTLDENYNVALNVENKDMQYLNAVVELPDGEASLLYSAVVLPDMTGTMEIDAKSTAITWIFMGMGVSVTSQKDKQRTLYDTVKANVKVQELANYIDTLQKNDFNAWVTQSDETLKTKFQDALKDVISTPMTKSLQALTSEGTEENTIVITQDPVNGNIYIDDNIYYAEYNTGNKLNNGSVNIINDTRLYLSIEVTDSENDEIIGEYYHFKDAIHMLEHSIIGPKGWFLTGFSKLKNVNLNGRDAHIEIIAGSYGKEGLSEAQSFVSNGLITRVWVQGVAAPALNMIISTFLDKKIENHYGKDNFPLSRRVVTAMSDIYGSGFWAKLSLKVADDQVAWSTLANDFIYTPVVGGINDCYNNGVSSTKCEQTAKAILELAGCDNMENVGQTLMLMIAQAAAKSIGKKSLAAVPVAGWVLAASFAVYDNIGYITDGGTIGESLWDMNYNPRLFNVDVDFPLEVSNVDPLCIATVSSQLTQEFKIKGEGFTVDNGTSPEVFIGKDTDITASSKISVLEGGTDMNVMFNIDDLMNDGSWNSYLSVKYLGTTVMYDELIRMVSVDDTTVYFDAIEPNSAYRGATVTLKGCGWIPLNDIKVYFNKEKSQEYVEAEILSSTVDTITVKVPDTARSGAVYVTAGNKETKKLLFDINPFSLNEAYEGQSILKDLSETLSGHELEQATKIYFTDHTGKKIEGTINSSDEYSLNVQIPEGLSYGSVEVYAENEKGIVTNKIALPLVPVGVDAKPLSQSFTDTIEIILTQEDDVDIFYRIDDGEEQEYTGPIVLNVDDAKYTYFSIYTFSSVVVDDVNYTSNELEYQYRPIICYADEELVDGVCESIFEGHNCPLVYDATLDDHPDNNWSIVLPIRDKDGDGKYEDHIYCGYTVYNEGHIYHTTHHIDNREIFRIYYFESGAIKSKYARSSETMSVKPLAEWYRETGELWFKAFYDSLDVFIKTEEYRITHELYREYEWGGTNSNALSGYVSSRSGSWKQYHKDGKTQQYELHFSGGLRDGIKKEWYESGNLRYEVLYVNDHKKGWETYYYDEKEEKKSRETYYIDTFTIDGIQKTWYESGQLRQEISWDHDIKNGIEKYYYDLTPEQLKYETPYVDGNISGIKKEYYESGQPSYVTPYANGNIHGTKKAYYDLKPEQLRYEIPYVSGNMDGTAIYYYESGQHSSEIPYVDGTRHGQYKRFSETGKMTSCTIYDMGSSTGSCMP